MGNLSTTKIFLLPDGVNGDAEVTEDTEAAPASFENPGEPQ